MLTLTEFLLARIAEDEAVASPLANADTRSALREGSRDYVESTPARVLTECEAKRRIVELHPRDDEGFCGDNVGLVGCKWLWPCPTLHALALPYADHDQFQEEWRV